MLKPQREKVTNCVPILWWLKMMIACTCSFLLGLHTASLSPCMSKDDDKSAVVKTVMVANNKPSNGAAVFMPSILPDHCDSTQRGVFDRIYAQGFWQKESNYSGPRKVTDFYNDANWPANPIQQISASGPGSNLGIMTKASLQVLKDAIVKYNVTSMIDVPCGDVNWIFDSFITDSLPIYIGLDVTSAVIKINQERFAHHKNKQFHFWDATECNLPKLVQQSGDKSVDLVHVRDVIQHLTLEQGIKYFCNVFKSGAKVLVTTSHQNGGLSSNTNISEGSYYNCDVFLEPFSFPESQRKNCFKHDRIERRAYTCTFDLSEGDWVNNFIDSKC